MDNSARIDHDFRLAAFAIAWAVQFAYLAWLGYKGRQLHRKSAERRRNS